MKLLSETRTFFFEEDVNRRANIQYKKEFQRWNFVSCNYSFDRTYNLEDWIFLGKLAAKVEELLKELNKVKK